MTVSKISVVLHNMQTYNGLKIKWKELLKNVNLEGQKTTFNTGHRNSRKVSPTWRWCQKEQIGRQVDRYRYRQLLVGLDARDTRCDGRGTRSETKGREGLAGVPASSLHCRPAITVRSLSVQLPPACQWLSTARFVACRTIISRHILVTMREKACVDSRFLTDVA